MTVVACANRGCGKSFDSNSVQGCQFHPGGPIFHDALKGWSCCNKRVVEFDAFLKIPGCTTGLHSTSISELPKPEREQAPVPPSESTSVDNGKVGKVTEKFTTSAIEKPKAEEVKKVPESDLNDPIDAEIEIGAKCKRPACGLPYENESSRTQQCIYHSGAPVFHEGSKGWSCCTRKVLDFNDFLKIKGCKTGLHRFTDIQPVGPVLYNNIGCGKLQTRLVPNPRQGNHFYICKKGRQKFNHYQFVQ